MKNFNTRKDYESLSSFLAEFKSIESNIKNYINGITRHYLTQLLLNLKILRKLLMALIIVPDLGKEVNEVGEVVSVGPGQATITGELIPTTLKVRRYSSITYTRIY